MANQKQPPTEESTAAAIRAIWDQNLPLVEERIRILEAAASAALVGALSQPKRQEAKGIAHKLAGSLGMFGFAEGTRIARELERILSSDSAASSETAEMHQLVSQLRAVVLGPPKA